MDNRSKPEIGQNGSIDGPFSQVHAEPAAEAVTRQIEELVLTGVYRPGDRLPSERDLAKEFDLSRPTLRLALKDLEKRGLLISRHGGGTFVAEVLGSIFSDPIIELFHGHARATTDYLEFRREIEALTARFAARRATDADREILKDVFRRMEAAHSEEDFTNEARIDMEFHAAIGEASHNVVLLHTLRSCYQLLNRDIFYNRSFLYTYPGARDRLLEQHRNIYDGVMNGNEVEAAEAAARHIRYVEDSLRDAERESSRKATAERRLAMLRSKNKSARGRGSAVAD